MHKTTSVIPTTFADLSPEFQKVIKKMQEVSFGVIHDLPIANGQPQLPQARVVRSCKLSNSRPTAQSKQNFQLCQQHLYFMSLVEQIQNGLIQRLEVQHGLPFHIDYLE
jgi:hypothetical protein